MRRAVVLRFRLMRVWVVSRRVFFFNSVGTPLVADGVN